MIEFNPTPNTDPLAGKLPHIETSLAEKLHVLGRHRHREVFTIVRTEVYVRPALVYGRGLHRPLDYLERAGTCRELLRSTQHEGPALPASRPLQTRLIFGCHQKFG